MRNIMQRIAYLEGLADGLGIDDNTKEGQILLELIDIVGELVETVEDEFQDLENYLDLMEEDLCDLEDYVYEDEDDEYDLDDFDDFDDEFDIYEGYESLGEGANYGAELDFEEFESDEDVEE